MKVLFFPPNVTSLFQPMDQGIIMTTKLFYQHCLINELLSAQKDRVTLIQFLKTVYLYKVIDWLSAAWNKVRSDIVSKFGIIYF